jgi:hypothetical protein
MRRALEVVLVVFVLVAVPISVAVVARSEPSSGPPQLSAAAFAQPILALAHLTPTHCRWTNGHAGVECAMKGGGTCTFQLGAHTGTCTDDRGESSTSVTFVWANSP